MVRAIFLFMHGDLTVAESPQKAAASMEAVDVEAGEYEAIFDDSGVLYEPAVDGRKVARLLPTENRDYEDLVARLNAYGERAGLALPVGDPDLPVFAARCIAERAWQRRWPKRPGWLSRRLHDSGPPRFDNT